MPGCCAIMYLLSSSRYPRNIGADTAVILPGNCFVSGSFERMKECLTGLSIMACNMQILNQCFSKKFNQQFFDTDSRPDGINN